MLKKNLIFSLIFFFILSSAIVTEADKLIYNLKKDKLNFGKIITEKTEKNGFLEIRSIQTIKVKLFFVEQVFSEDISMKMDLNSGTRSIRLISNSPVKNRTTEVMIYKNRAVIKEINVDGSKKETRLESKEKLYFEMDYFVLNKNLQINSGQEFTYKTVDVETLSIKTNRVMVLKKLSTGKRWGQYVFKVKRAMYESIETYDFDFNVIRIEVQNPKITIELTENQTEEIKSFEIKDGDLMEYKIKLPTSNIEEIKTVVFKISSSPESFEYLNLIDERQKIISEKIEEKLKYHEIKIAHVSVLKDLDKNYKEIDISKEKKYLQGTALIRKDSKILDPIIESIIKDETKLVKIIEKTIMFMQKEIKADIIPESLNSDEVITLKKGMCMHYGVVFAAIMRRLNIPCRCVMGEIYNYDRFLPHMYNEIYNGEKWITIDSTKKGLNLITSNPLLLKLAHGVDLTDLAIIKSKLINNFKINKVDIKKE